MFTGLISELGTVSAITKGESSAIFTINAPLLINEIKLGDSVAVNGVCLTATSITERSFTADVMVQTLSLTSLSQVSVGSAVNLELAAQLNARMGGHMVSGHIDGVATVVGLTQGDKWLQFDIKVPENLSKYIVNQGSIALDGVSLTVGEINEANLVTVWLIPETLTRTNLAAKKPGELVNVEVDLIAKYVERLITKGDKS
ncbi:MAG: riboflavin synthase [Candidatus Nanopelagicus sp.]|jgi:riboflavin synthase|nr:riboflavin synthase [Candidatus Nanopelagicus sp.]